ncbi:MAG TPA: 50S ribosomal protein L23 [Alphaproteobacteria bacterium]|nr:50S ribosomal protein L23 [Alphaproteobacteria bacterium]
MTAVKKKKAEAVQVTEAMYNTILRPVITEKATMASEHGQVAFWVAPGASKPEIKEAVQALFKVEVTKVNTITLHGKTKRFKGKLGVRGDRKKALVTLKSGQSIDISTGLPK